MNRAILTRLRHRLESAELEHLRALVAEQAAEIERLAAENARLEDDAAAADRFAHFWREQHDQLQDAYYTGTPAPAVGITRAGELVGVAPSGEQKPL